MELLYYWQKMSWLSVWFITVKIGLFTFCIENRIKEVALWLLILSFLLFIFLLAEKVICSIIMLYVPRRRIKTKAKLLKKVYGNINGFIGGCFFVCLSGFKHSRDFSDPAMQLLMICVSVVLGMIYYPYIIAIPFNLIYKEEIDADLGL